MTYTDPRCGCDWIHSYTCAYWPLFVMPEHAAAGQSGEGQPTDKESTVSEHSAEKGVTRHNHRAAAACGRACPAYGDMLMEKTAARFNTPLTQNERGEWVPAIPEPLRQRFRRHCDCGATRWTMRGYREHYALTHILGLAQ